MRPFIFSCDAHIAEPGDIFTSKLPAHLQKWAIHPGKGDEKYRVTMIGDTEILRVRVDFHAHKTGQGDSGPEADRSCTDDKDSFISDCAVDTKRRGARDLDLRAQDMDRDGVDAELVFPSLGLMLPRIADREGQRESCRIYNDWAWDYTRTLGDRLVPAAMIPSTDFDDALAECKRTAAMGYAAFCIWEGLDNYNDLRWDPIFKFAGENDIPIVFHTGVGTTSIRALKGPGSGMYNYTRQNE